MLRPLHIALLEVKRYLVSIQELAFSVALPIVLFALMYGAFGGEESFHATAHVVDLDNGTYARSLIDRLNALDEITVRERTLDDANKALDRSAILTAVVIPVGFSAGIEAGEPVAITFRKRGNGGDAGQIVEAIVRSVAQQMAGEANIRSTVSGTLMESGVPKDRIDAVVARLIAESRLRPSIGVETRSLGGDEPDPTDRLVPGLLVMFLMFAVTMNAQTLVEERQNGTLERLMTTRLGVNQLFLGKFMAGVLRAVVQALVLLALAFAVLRVGDIADFAELTVFSALVAMAVSAIGLVIGSIARTRDPSYMGRCLHHHVHDCLRRYVLRPDWLRTIGHSLPIYAYPLRNRLDVRDAGKRSDTSRSGRWHSRTRGSCRYRPCSGTDDVQGSRRWSVTW